MSEAKQAGARWILPLIGAVAVVLSLFVPMSCNASANGTAYATQDGGPIMLGALAIALAAWALIKGRRGAPAVAAMIVAALGAAQLARGVLSMEHVQSAVDTIDLDGPVRQFFERLRDDQVAAILADAEPEVQQLGRPFMHGLGAGYTRVLGRWQSFAITDRKMKDDLVDAVGDARYERGPLHFELVFRLHGGTAHLAGVTFDHPGASVPPIADAERTAHELVEGVVAGDVARVHDRLDPRIELPADLDDKLRALHDALGGVGTIEQLSSKDCPGGHCIELRASSPSATVNAHLRFDATFGIWLATSFNFDSTINVK